MKMRQKNNKIDILFNGIEKEDSFTGQIEQVEGLKQMVLSNSWDCEGEISLILSIIEQAAKDDDIDFFNNQFYYGYCRMLGINANKLLNIIVRIWETE
jgi:hypothetical protein